MDPKVAGIALLWHSCFSTKPGVINSSNAGLVCTLIPFEALTNFKPTLHWANEAKVTIRRPGVHWGPSQRLLTAPDAGDYLSKPTLVSTFPVSFVPKSWRTLYTCFWDQKVLEDLCYFSHFHPLWLVDTVTPKSLNPNPILYQNRAFSVIYNDIFCELIMDNYILGYRLIDFYKIYFFRIIVFVVVEGCLRLYKARSFIKHFYYIRLYQDIVVFDLASQNRRHPSTTTKTIILKK